MIYTYYFEGPSYPSCKIYIKYLYSHFYRAYGMAAQKILYPK